MTITGTVQVRCPGCHDEQACKLVQSINARLEPELARRLVAGDLNVLACACGRRTQLAVTLLYHDPDHEYFCQACPGGEAAMEKGLAAFRAIGTAGTRRLVPSQNALIEKVKLLDAGIADHVAELLKVLMLAASNSDLDSIVLFDSAEADLLRWVLLADGGRVVASPRAAYDKLAATAPRPRADELRIDRAWAVEAARVLTTRMN